ncbi:MAG TPA: hypothetical protein VGO16_06235 [Pseudonocardiaceae bacterium]|nr:hypothetical protein [Pseudonocardiaceae bacterium]
MTGLLRELAREHNLVLMMSTHDVDLALRVADQVTVQLTTPTAAGARVLAWLGWEVATTGPTDIEVRATGTDFDVHGDGCTRRVDGLAGLAGWARTVRPGPLRRADPVEVTAALVALARFGPFFAVHLDQPDNAALSVAERISSAARRLGTQDRRVAASILFQAWRRGSGHRYWGASRPSGSCRTCPHPRSGSFASTAGSSRAYRTPAAGSPPRTPTTLPRWSNSSGPSSPSPAGYCGATLHPRWSAPCGYCSAAPLRTLLALVTDVLSH